MRLHGRYRRQQFETGSPLPTGILTSNFLSTTPTNNQMTAAEMLSTHGLVFTRTTTSTVQISEKRLVSGVPINSAAFGKRNALLELGLVIQQSSYSDKGAPRVLTTGRFAGSGATNTNPVADSPDQSGTGCSRVVLTSGGKSPYMQEFTGSALVRTFSAWVKSTSIDKQMTWVNTLDVPNAASIQVVSPASPDWEVISLTRNAVALYSFTACDGRDFSLTGGQTARARDCLVDYLSYEFCDWRGEAIDIANSSRTGDRVSYASAAGLVVAGRFSYYCKLTPKFSTTMAMRFNVTGTIQTQTATYLYGCGPVNAAGNWARINNTTRLLEVSTKNGAAAAVVVTSAIACSWSQYDIVEFYINVGNAAASVAKYRVNGGAWIDLQLPASASHVFGADVLWILGTNATFNLDVGQFPSWLHYVAAGGVVEPS